MPVNTQGFCSAAGGVARCRLLLCVVCREALVCVWRSGGVCGVCACPSPLQQSVLQQCSSVAVCGDSQRGVWTWRSVVGTRCSCSVVLQQCTISELRSFGWLVLVLSPILVMSVTAWSQLPLIPVCTVMACRSGDLHVLMHCTLQVQTGVLSIQHSCLKVVWWL